MPNPIDTKEDWLDIHGTSPSVLVRKGIGVLFLFFILLLGILGFIQYPEKVILDVVIDPISNSFIYRTCEHCQIDSIYKKRGELVKKEERLAALFTRDDSLITLKAPFQGTFFSLKNIENNETTFYVLDVNRKAPNIQGVASRTQVSKLEKNQDVKIHLKDEKEIEFRGYISDIVSIPLKDSCYIHFQLDKVNQKRLYAILENENVLYDFHCTAEIHMNSKSILEKMLGVIGEKL